MAYSVLLMQKGRETEVKTLILCLLCFCIGGVLGVLFMALFAAQRREDDG